MTSDYFYTYNSIFDNAVSGNAKLVYAYLCKCADDTGKCFPAQKTIGAVCSIGVTTVKKALSELESVGLITTTGQARPNKPSCNAKSALLAGRPCVGRRANIYTIIADAVKGFFITYKSVFLEKLTAKARLVYLYFCRLASGKDSAYPAHKTTAKACGLSVGGVRLAIDELEDKGLIERSAQYRDNGGQKSNLYYINKITEEEKKDSGNKNTTESVKTIEIVETESVDKIEIEPESIIVPKPSDIAQTNEASQIKNIAIISTEALVIAINEPIQKIGHWLYDIVRTISNRIIKHTDLSNPGG